MPAIITVSPISTIAAQDHGQQMGSLFSVGMTTSSLPLQTDMQLPLKPHSMCSLSSLVRPRLHIPQRRRPGSLTSGVAQTPSAHSNQQSARAEWVGEDVAGEEGGSRFHKGLGWTCNVRTDGAGRIGEHELCAPGGVR